MVNVILVGGGGGGSHADYAGTWKRGGNGGQGALITGSIQITKGTNYSITVGAMGAAGIGGNTVQAGNGGDSIAFGQTAGGGKGSYSHTGYFDNGHTRYGEGGTATVSAGFTGTNGANTTTDSIYGSYGGGGLGNSSTATAGQVGYVKITAV